ncbi:MAG: pilus assembly protein N-terminal domain-containing protein [Pirellulales bacterium]
MVLNRLTHVRCLRWTAALLAAFVTLSSLADEITAPPPVIQNITTTNSKVEIAVNSSRILKMDSPIPRAQVGNPELLAFTVLSENEVQIHAKKAGITTVNLWDDKDEVHSIDVVITGDVRELEGLLKTQFPTTSIKLYPTQASTLIIFGYVDRPDYVNTIMRIAEDYYPKVINNMTVGGTQQVLLHVRVMEVSRTNLKALGFDFANFSGGNFTGSTAAGLISKANPVASVFRTGASLTSSGAETLQFGIVSNPSGFVGFLEALKRENLLKVLAEPNLVTVSGRPASYLVGGEMPYPQPTGFGNISINFKPFGTQVDFVPIVLGNGSVRLEVRPQVSELDPTLSISIAGTSVPGFRERMVDTGVEMKFGQTLAIAGLLQQRVENEKRGIPYLMDVPYLGALFGRIQSRINEVELLILVRPELVEAMDPDQVPQCAGPGMSSQIPDDCGLYWKRYIETPVQPYGPQGHGPAGYGPGPMMQEHDGSVPEQVIPTPAPTSEEIPTTKVPARPKTTVVASDRGQNGLSAPPSSRRPAYAHQAPAVTTRSPSYNPANRQAQRTSQPANPPSDPPGFIGPIGYDVKN